MSKLLLITGAVTTLAAFAYHESAIAAPRGAPAVSSRSEPSRSVWDSVYTDSQAVKGDSAYKESCVKCHGATLAGGDDGSPLAGKEFLANWNGLSVGELYDKIHTTMPPDNPKSIPRPQLAAIVAYMFAQNRFPAGTKPLSDDAAALNAIKILQAKP